MALIWQTDAIIKYSECVIVKIVENYDESYLLLIEKLNLPLDFRPVPVVTMHLLYLLHPWTNLKAGKILGDK